MTEATGDDLIAARRFMNLCQSNMSEIFSGHKIPFSDVIMRLADIQSQAKLMHARSIYRSAQTVIDDLTRRQSVSECVGSVLTLQNLIRQYDEGLTEISPKKAKTNPVNAQKAPGKGPAIISDLSQQTEAAKILGPLIKFADKPDQKNLISLLSRAANDKPKQKKPVKRKVGVIMPSLTNHWLRLARTNQKSISVSVASDDVNIDVETLKALQSIILRVGNSLVQDCVSTPEIRAAQNISRSAHLAVTTRLDNDSLNILVSCEGKLPSQIRSQALQSEIEALGGRFVLTENNGEIRTEMLGIPLDGRSPDKLIQGAAS